MYAYRGTSFNAPPINVVRPNYIEIHTMMVNDIQPPTILKSITSIPKVDDHAKKWYEKHHLLKILIEIFQTTKQS